MSSEEIAQREEEIAAREAKERAATLLAKANIPKRHAIRQEFEGEGWLSLHARLKTKIGTGFMVALLGKRGTGKTQLAVSIAKHFASVGKRPFYSTAMGFFLDIKETFGTKAESERTVIEKYCQPSLLILDEMQVRGETNWHDNILTHLLDRRYADLKDTLLISNLTRENFIASIGESVASRMSETKSIAVCDWESFRTK